MKRHAPVTAGFLEGRRSTAVSLRQDVVRRSVFITVRLDDHGQNKERAQPSPNNASP
ncbi:hypothetical protein [Geobacillus sp. BMUD]|uniref:hypothetical protein n=1 Tax=Geobacillus sp. BMUD TaxID=2508876 RepID=UPI001490B230|nr:hypothetical protein [Geobacillus sp. BMUD]